MTNRKLPFGYELQCGVICISVPEASVVKEIFEVYSKGMSYSQIAEHLKTQAVPYCERGKPWNKNMVARILNGEHYIGDDQYPAILSYEEHRRAVSAKPAAAAPSDNKSKTVRQLSRCAVCGSTLKLSGNKYGWARWNCPSCNVISSDAVMPDTIDALSLILAVLKADPGLIQAPPQPDQSVPRIPVQLESELDSLIRADEFDESAAKAKAASLASARFQALGAEDYETMRIQYILGKTEQTGDLNTALLRQISDAILIHPAGEVSLKLKNGQIIERSDLSS